jgi:hypothetical protein
MSLANSGFLFIIITLLLILVIGFLDRKKVTGNLRVIPSFEQLQKALNLIVESGKGAHITVGRASILSPQAGSTLAAVEMLSYLSRLCLNGDIPPLSTSGDGVVNLLAIDALRKSYRAVHLQQRFHPLSGQVTGVSAYSYVVGAMLAQRDENRTLTVAMGSFGPEIGLLADTSERMQAHTIAGTDNLLAQAVLYATSRSPLIGEEFFAAGAYTQGTVIQNASLKTQDILRVLLVIGMVIGSILKMAGAI